MTKQRSIGHCGLHNRSSLTCSTASKRESLPITRKGWRMFFSHDGKGVVLAVLLMALLFSCNHRATYQTGDLLFVEGNTASSMEQAIMGSTGKMVHVGIVEVVGDSVFIIDAAPKTGVSRRPLQAFLEAQKGENGALPALKHTRLKDNRHVEEFVAKAKRLCGVAYDFAFLPDNNRYYCSELVYDCYQRDGKPIFESAPMNFRNDEGEFDLFWVEMFAKQGMEIPQNVSGTNPDALSRSNILLEIKAK